MGQKKIIFNFFFLNLEINVQNGVLKALSFMFEYIGEMAKDYIYAVTPLLVDAMMERWKCIFFYNSLFNFSLNKFLEVLY